MRANVSPLLEGPVKTELQAMSWTSDGDYAVVLVKSATSYQLHVNVAAGQSLPTSSTFGAAVFHAISHISRFVCVNQ